MSHYPAAIELNDVAVGLAAQILPRVMVVEDVVGFRHNQQEAYDSFLGKLRAVFNHVEVFVANALHAMVAQNRNRLFIICTQCRKREGEGVDLSLVRRQLLRWTRCGRSPVWVMHRNSALT